MPIAKQPEQFEEQVEFSNTKTTRERQKALRERREKLGMVQVSGWVHADQAAELRVLIAALKADPTLTVGPAKDTRTGQLRRVR
ncbi:hypothetical protein NKH09_17515 [Mesorhizobium sp. M1339]|uniref:hypothetical protein n=1 Tax=Mesorhizobium sp. M1339 TaxID=2957086 RepID=UPI00333B382F